MFLVIINALIIVSLSGILGYYLFFKKSSKKKEKKKIEKRPEKFNIVEKNKKKKVKKKPSNINQRNKRKDFQSSPFFHSSLKTPSSSSVLDVEVNKSCFVYILKDVEVLYVHRINRVVKKQNRPLFSHSFQEGVTSQYPTSISLSRENNEIAISLDCSDGHRVKVFHIDLKSRKLEEKVNMSTPLENEVIVLNYLPLHRIVSCVCKDSDRIYFFSTDSGDLLKEFSTGAVEIKQFRISNDGRFVAFSSFFKNLKVLKFDYSRNNQTDELSFNVNSRAGILQKCSDLDHKESVVSFCFTNNSKRVVTSTEENISLYFRKKPKYKNSHKVSDIKLDVFGLETPPFFLETMDGVLVLMSDGIDGVLICKVDWENQKLLDEVIRFKMGSRIQVMQMVDETNFFVATKGEIHLFMIKQRSKKKN